MILMKVASCCSFTKNENMKRTKYTSLSIWKNIAINFTYFLYNNLIFLFVMSGAVRWLDKIQGYIIRYVQNLSLHFYFSHCLLFCMIWHALLHCAAIVFMRLRYRTWQRYRWYGQKYGMKNLIKLTVEY